MPEIGYIMLLEVVTERIRTQFLTERGKMLKALLQYETLIGDDWVPVVRYDTAHGVFHKDILHQNGTKEKREVNYVELDEAVQDAQQDLFDNWESYKFRYFQKKG
jgi:hypothetical protein